VVRVGRHAARHAHGAGDRRGVGIGRERGARFDLVAFRTGLLRIRVPLLRAAELDGMRKRLEAAKR